MTDISPKKKNRRSQRISLVMAYLCYLCALITIGLAIYKGYELGTENPIFASLAATVVFFTGAGVVLHVMGAVNLPDLSLKNKD